MTDTSNLKNLSLRRRTGYKEAPPTMDEASPNLEAPEHAPARPVIPPNVRIDGRSLRRSHRTIQFATRVSPEFDERIRSIAQRDKLLLVEVLEKALDAYEKARK